MSAKITPHKGGRDQSGRFRLTPDEKRRLDAVLSLQDLSLADYIVRKINEDINNMLGKAVYYSFKNSAGGVNAYHSFKVLEIENDTVKLGYGGVWNANESDPHFHEEQHEEWVTPISNVWLDGDGEYQLSDFPKSEQTTTFNCHTWTGWHEFQVTNQMPSQDDTEYTFHTDGDTVIAIRNHEYDFHGWRHSVVIATNAPVTTADELEEDGSDTGYYSATVTLPVSLLSKIKKAIPADTLKIKA